MKASVEISMYPLDPDYGTPILKFIGRLKAHPELKIQSNQFSTHIHGDYDVIMSMLTREMKTTFEEEKAVVMVLKILNLDLS